MEFSGVTFVNERLNILLLMDPSISTSGITALVASSQVATQRRVRKGWQQAYLPGIALRARARLHQLARLNDVVMYGCLMRCTVPRM